MAKKIIYLVAILAAFGAAYYLGQRKRASTLDAFAQCVGKGAKMYGLYWCTHCADQKDLFGDSFRYIPYVECGIKGSQKEEQGCVAAGVRNFPTWEFAGGERRDGPQSLQFLSQKTGCKLP
jgi:hypothetical protein